VARAVLFDLDDTLFDHRRSARAALQEVHRGHAADLDFAAFERQHGIYLEEMHVEVLAGRIGLDDARRERFRKVFLALGVTLDGPAVDAVASAYRSGYMSARRALHGARTGGRAGRVRRRGRLQAGSGDLPHRAGPHGR
jgi:putative hydrolase of the HAD superfamily